MDMRETDDRLREAFRVTAPQVDGESFCEVTGAKLASSQARYRHWRALRLAGTVCVALVLLAGLSVGVFEAVGHLRGPSAVVVITDPVPSELNPGSTTTSTAQVTQDFQGLWAGNVQTVPEHPTSLPQGFYAEPATPAQLVMGKPLWIFANEVSPEAVVAAVKDASKEQTILIFDPSEHLAELLDVPVNQRPSSMGELSPLFTQRPLLTRDNVFEEVGAHWWLTWVDMGAQATYGSNYDPVAVYASGAAATMEVEEGHRVTENNKANATTSTTAGGPTTTDQSNRYPIQKSVQSAQADNLAREAAQELYALTGEKFQLDKALENQMIGPQDKIEERSHTADYALVGPEGKGPTYRGLTYGVYWSAQDQLAFISSNTGGRPSAPFDMGAGSKGIIMSLDDGTGYQAIIQLSDGMTANVSTWGPPAWKLQPPAVSSPLTSEQLMAFTRWLVVQAEYLHP